MKGLISYNIAISMTHCESQGLFGTSVICGGQTLTDTQYMDM